MKYYLTKLAGDRQEFLEITEEEYNKIGDSKDRLFQALFLEQKFDLVVENYVEYELELIKSTAHQMLFHDQSWAYYSGDINRISRRIVNLLTASRLYLDQIIHHLNTIYGPKNEKVEIITKQKSAEYDEHSSYRIMEALRNYVQHRGFPLHGCTYNSKRVDAETGFDGKLLYTITPYLSLEKLKKDKKFKKSVLKDFEGADDKIDIKPIIRGFIASIGNIHDRIRGLLKTDIESWERHLFELVQSFNRKYGLGEQHFDTDVVIYNEKGLFVDTTHIFKDFLEHRTELERKNRHLNSLPYRFLTSQSVKKNV